MTRCPAGYYNSDGAQTCSACAPGSYSTAGASNCTACLAGSASPGTASSCTTCSAGTFAPGNSSTCSTCAPGSYSAAGASNCTACLAGSASPGNASSCTTCSAGTFAPGNSSTCSTCPPGLASGSSAAACDSLCVHPPPASCNGAVFIFSAAPSGWLAPSGWGAANATTGCGYGSYANLTAGTWVAGSSTCTDCPPGTVSLGWPNANNSLGPAACLNVTVRAAAVACNSSASAAVNVTFSGGESRAGVAPSASDLTTAQLEIDANPTIAGTLDATQCVANAMYDGYFTCSGLAVDAGVACTAAGTAPIGSLAGTTAVGSFFCSSLGAAAASFSGAYYPVVGVQASDQDVAYVQTYAPPSSVAPFSGALVAAPASGTASGTCYVDAVNTVTCYGWMPAAGWVCGATGASLTPCGAGFFSASSSVCGICPSGTYSNASSNGACSPCPSGSNSAANSVSVSDCLYPPSPSSLAAAPPSDTLSQLMTSTFTVSSSVTLFGLGAVADFNSSVQQTLVVALETLLRQPAGTVSLNSNGITTSGGNLSIPFGVSTSAGNSTALCNAISGLDVNALTSIAFAASPAVVVAVGTPLLSTPSLLTVQLGLNVSAAASVVAALLGAHGAQLTAAQEFYLEAFVNSAARSDATASDAALLVSAVVSVLGTNASAIAELSLRVLASNVPSSGTISNVTGAALLSAAGAALSSPGAPLSASAAADAAFVIVAATRAVDLTNNSVATSVLTLANITARGSADLTGSVLRNITLALSEVAALTIPLNRTAAAAVADVLDVLIASLVRTLVMAISLCACLRLRLLRMRNLFCSPQSAALLAAVGHSPSPVVSTSLNINISLTVVAQPEALYGTPITMPGAAASFDPLPSGSLAAAGASPVVLLFAALAFDPHLGAGSSSFTIISGVTRLEFFTPAGPLLVSNLTKPITFTLPSVTTSGSEAAACTFYDTVTGGYSTQGCSTVPNPRPPNHVLSFTPGFTSFDDAGMANAWSITGPLAVGCASVVIDCPGAQRTNIVPGEPNRNVASIFADPQTPLLTPAVKCPVNSSKPVYLRVFWGHDCALWQYNNSANCWWDNTLQVFNGTGCINWTGGTQCTCRHATDFAAARTPKIATCSLSDMVALNPGDLLSKLKFLFIVVLTLFGFMNLGAVVGFNFDLRERAMTLKKLQAPETGFVEQPGGVWTWTLTQLPPEKAVEPLRGTAPALARQMGIPFVRLRAALPEELFAGSMSWSVGRATGLSVAGIEEALVEHGEVMQQMRRTSSARMSKQETRRSLAGVSNSGARSSTQAGPRRYIETGGIWDDASPGVLYGSAPSSNDKARQLAGTALAFAFLGTSKTLPVVTLAQQRSAASAYFAGIRLSGIDHDFDTLVTLFMGMLAEGNLSGRSRWLSKARMWRLLYLQRADGGWDLSDGIAFALEARSGEPIEDTKCLVARVGRIVALAAAALNPGQTGGLGVTDALVRDGTTSCKKRAIMTLGESWPDDDGECSWRNVNDAINAGDCPLTFSRDAIKERMPLDLASLGSGRISELASRRLSELRVAADDTPARQAESLPAARVWATVLALAALEDMEHSWLYDEEEPIERTIVDAGMAYLQRLAKDSPTLNSMLRSGDLQASARHTRGVWALLLDQAVAGLRNASAARNFEKLEHSQRASARFVRSLMIEHSQFATFLDASCAVMRWQRWMSASLEWLSR